MTEILPIGRKELIDLGLSFVTCPVPAFSSVAKSYVMDVFWFLDLDMVKEQCSPLDPLIIFDTSDVYAGETLHIDESKLPKEIVANESGYMLRAVIDIDKKNWAKIIDNIFFPKEITYTFDWGLEDYDNELVKKYIVGREQELERNKEKDLLQLEELRQAKQKKYDKFLDGIG